MAKAKVLIIEDSRQTLQILGRVLHKASYHPLLASNGSDGIALFLEEQPDLVLLDINMPGMNGWEVCRHIRQTSDVPILMLSAEHVDVEARVKGLDLGANDYILKPFNHQELLARIRTNLRISPKLVQRNSYDDNHLSIDLVERKVVYDGRELDLTEKEFALLSVLLRFASNAVPSETLFEKVWGYPDSFDANYVRIYMSSLRKKIEPDPKNPIYIHTERGVGYRFVAQKENGFNGGQVPRDL
ncbi:MAG: response regulator transcription factor [Chloroflexi bacterium]|nr:response regulator transcription factor [Chloroflexota bacterium]